MVAMASSHRAAPGGLPGRMGIWMMEKVMRRALRLGIDPVVRRVFSCAQIEEAPRMRLTGFSDCALRLLIHAARHPDRLVTIEEAATAYGISRSHLTKVTNVLTRAGFLNSVRGRSGGLELGRDPAGLTLGEVLRVTEPDMAAAECFGPDEIRDPNRPDALDAAIRDALAAFLAAMDQRTLADMLAEEQE